MTRLVQNGRERRFIPKWMSSLTTLRTWVVRGITTRTKEKHSFDIESPDEGPCAVIARDRDRWCRIWRVPVARNCAMEKKAEIWRTTVRYWWYICEIATTKKPVSGAVASYYEIRAHVLRKTKLRDVSYDEINAKERKKGGKLMKWGMTYHCSCVSRVFGAYVWGCIMQIKSAPDVIRNGSYMCAACVVVIDGRSSCDTLHRF